MGKHGGDHVLQGQEGGNVRDGGNQVEGQLQASSENLSRQSYDIARAGDGGVRDAAASAADLALGYLHPDTQRKIASLISDPAGTELLIGLIEGSRGVFHRDLLTGIDPRNPEVREAFLNAIKNV